MMYYQIIRANGSSKNYKIFSEMLDDFDRQDVINLHRLVNERYETTSPEGYDLLLWGDLKTLFEPNEEDEIWKNQQDYNLISWRLFDSCGVHVLLMNTRVAIHMMIEKKYPLTQEMLSRMLNRRLEDDLCSYLFLFAYGDVESSRVIMDALEEFKLVSGLTPSLPKSMAYFCNVLNYIKVSILQVLPFEEGHLPVKYLGVPCISIRLIYRDCRELIEKVQNQINDWKNKSLSVAGRLQLIKSVIGSMHIYWASVFILPSRILLDLEQSVRDFLWCQGQMTRGRAKVLQLRPIIREFIWLCVGNGTTVSAWFDQWSHVGPISRIVSNRDIFRADFNWDTKLQDLICNGMWTWPDEFPRFSFHLWLVIHGKLKTQDKLRDWDTRSGLVLSCPLCDGQTDTHDHLFFHCPFSTQVWGSLKDLADFSNVPGRYKDIVDYINPFAKRRSCKSVIAKLVFSASVYYLWQERNARLFSNQKRSVKQVVDVIKSSVRLKLLSCSFKKSRDSMEFVHLWQLLKNIIFRPS
ncbi:reverse transcriptase domain, reverse transcriptase zinc-binding domain protein [Tanacetum coccineum]